MFRVDRDFFEYLKDLSNPSYDSSSDIESLQKKRAIVWLIFLTFVLGSIALAAFVLFFMFYLPGLFNVTFQLMGELAAYFVVNWVLFLVFLIFLFLFIFLYIRS